ncbi:dihydroorotase [Longimicrobium terrae]|uniref:Dihydroorotase n=1 Tax=Longimicrobium terrae TaxID=1639882 RepID=A0A841GLQ6_9BACT|nr:dihydroorotase [Longimicrobium terrae]MBB4635133.1 dihydroorotase [Longimicrobium terrae]MBB6069527.1 dihydroorotase [Longimicrobium terrae]NNC31671.1 dihydroorotase [Longimicrobium terrae]
MNPVLIRGGRVVDPSQRMDAVADVLLVDGRVARVGQGIDAPEGAETIDASGLVVTPGLVDVHVHLREPGQEHKETIRTGARAAAAGGFTTVVAMPNTDPPIDDPAAVGFVLAEGMRSGGARVFPTGCITMRQQGEQLTEFGELINAGAVAVTDDGKPVVSGGMLRMALEYALTFDLPVAVHEEDPTLARKGTMNEGIVASRLGLTGIPNAAEDVMIARDLVLAELTGARLHVQHVSTRLGVQLIREAKARGVRVTAEATPHHFTLTDAAVEAYRTDAKMNPPLRSEADRDAVRQGVRDGTLDVIATDHAPHHYDEKEQAFEDAPFGIVGLETALGLTYTELVATGLIDLPTMVERMSCAPARAMKLDGMGSLAEGSLADVTIMDVRAEWTVNPASFLSMSRNTPFTGRALRCRAVRTLVGGRTVWRETQAG